MRADFGIPYDVDTLKLIDDLRDWGLLVRAVVITRFEEQPSARVFKARLERRGVRVYTHRFTRGYPTDVGSDRQRRGLRRQRLHPDRTPASWWSPGPGPGSGKLATCLSQVYHEHLRGRRGGLREVRDVPDLEPAAEAPGERRLRGGDRRAEGRQPDRPVPPGRRTASRRSTTTATWRPSRCSRASCERITGRRLVLPVADRHGREPGGVCDRGRCGRARGSRAGGDPPLLPLRLRVRGRAGGARGRRPRGADHERARPRRRDRRSSWRPRARRLRRRRPPARATTGVCCGAAIALPDGTDRDRQELGADARRVGRGARTRSSTCRASRTRSTC